MKGNHRGMEGALRGGGGRGGRTGIYDRHGDLFNIQYMLTGISLHSETDLKEKCSPGRTAKGEALVAKPHLNFVTRIPLANREPTPSACPHLRSDTSHCTPNKHVI